MRFFEVTALCVSVIVTEKAGSPTNTVTTFMLSVSVFVLVKTWLSEAVANQIERFFGKKTRTNRQAYIYTKTYTNVHSSFTHNSFKLCPIQMSVNMRWTKGYLAIKRNDLRYIKQNRWISKALCQMEEAYCMVIFIWNSRKDKSNLKWLDGRNTRDICGMIKKMFCILIAVWIYE